MTDVCQGGHPSAERLVGGGESGGDIRRAAGGAGPGGDRGVGPGYLGLALAGHYPRHDPLLVPDGDLSKDLQHHLTAANHSLLNIFEARLNDLHP